MTLSEDEDESLAQFIELKVLAKDSDEEEQEGKRKCREENKGKQKGEGLNCNKKMRRIESETFSKIPIDLFPHIFKILSYEDLIACSLVCRFLNYAASDESLWRHLYCMRWGLLPATEKSLECAWKKLYIQMKRRVGGDPIQDSLGESSYYNENVARSLYTLELTRKKK